MVQGLPPTGFHSHARAMKEDGRFNHIPTYQLDNI
jgi:hypothetical protein